MNNLTNEKFTTEKRECLICDKITTSNFRIDAFNYVCSEECFKKATNEEDKKGGNHEA